MVGTVDEDFAVESLAGDVFLLGTSSWRIKRVEPGRVRVEDAHGAPPSIPFWNGEAPGRTLELSEAVASVREEIAEQPDQDAAQFLADECGLDEGGAKQADRVRPGGRGFARTRCRPRRPWSPSAFSTKAAGCNW